MHTLIAMMAIGYLREGDLSDNFRKTSDVMCANPAIVFLFFVSLRVTNSRVLRSPSWLLVRPAKSVCHFLRATIFCETIHVLYAKWRIVLTSCSKRIGRRYLKCLRVGTLPSFALSGLL